MKRLITAVLVIAAAFLMLSPQAYAQGSFARENHRIQPQYQPAGAQRSQATDARINNWSTQPAPTNPGQQQMNTGQQNFPAHRANPNFHYLFGVTTYTE